MSVAAQDLALGRLERRQIVLYHRPNDIHVYAKVVMDENGAHANDLMPWNLAMCIAKRFGDRTRCLADHLQMMHYLGLDELILLKR